MMNLVGPHLGAYRLTGCLRRGDLCHLYVGRAQESEAEVAFKVLHPEAARGVQSRGRTVAPGRRRLLERKCLCLSGPGPGQDSVAQIALAERPLSESGATAVANEPQRQRQQQHIGRPKHHEGNAVAQVDQEPSRLGADQHPGAPA